MTYWQGGKNGQENFTWSQFNSGHPALMKCIPGQRYLFKSRMRTCWEFWRSFRVCKGEEQWHHFALGAACWCLLELKKSTKDNWAWGKKHIAAFEWMGARRTGQRQRGQVGTSWDRTSTTDKSLSGYQDRNSDNWAHT